ncbi:MAG: M56 family metallopeptidase [Nakamurella sp.]
MTTLLVVLTLVLAVATTVPFAALPLVNGVRPSIVVPLLAAGSLVSAASVGVVLGLLALAVLGRIPMVADLGGWSIDALDVAVPVPPVIGVAAGVTAAVLISRMLWRTGRILLLLGRSEQLCRRLRGGGGPIVIVDDDQADAFTLAGLRGCIVISRGLLQALGPAEQRMLTGHELSHLRHRHHLYVHAVDLAVAANPLLHRASDAIRLGVERWADEDAAQCTGDRAAAAAALARTALTRSALRRGAVRDTGPVVPALGAVACHVSDRALALLAPAPRGAALTATVITLLVATITTTLVCAVQIHDGFEHAETAWLTLAR